MVQQSLEKEKHTAEMVGNCKELCNKVVDPDTNKTITNYRKVPQSPSLKATWMKAIYKELGNIAQDFSDGEKNI